MAALEESNDQFDEHLKFTVLILKVVCQRFLTLQRFATRW